jgi:hypothetical protein
MHRREDVAEALVRRLRDAHEFAAARGDDPTHLIAGRPGWTGWSASGTYGRVETMRHLAFLSIACWTGCSGVPFLLPDTRSPVDHARKVEPKCTSFREESATAALSPDSIDSVEPAYSYVNSGPNDREARLRGARILLKPLPGFSREALTRSLECHETRVTLGQAFARADDPYSLPGAWLDIDVDSVGDAFVVLVRTDEMNLARTVLSRAESFAKARD